MPIEQTNKITRLSGSRDLGFLGRQLLSSISIDQNKIQGVFFFFSSLLV